MRYSAPELVVLGQASLLVLGGEPGIFDNETSYTSQPMSGLVLGLDD